VELGKIAGWIAIVILGREFAVSGLRIIKAEEGVLIAASKMGKTKTISQIIAVILIIMQDIYAPFIRWDIGSWAMYIAVIITIISGIEYFYRFQINS
ncbi:MAG TPA: CDP-diacylglycerol--glycerol-3-phosphate 3-phosphatidyltransferase, partial [Syntrophomonas sp.]|nr:CDP-diacylglycerol--glycerol-3-phosphate 3-phosphatidyltransferase [Syntrophomonas sp.]